MCFFFLIVIIGAIICRLKRSDHVYSIILWYIFVFRNYMYVTHVITCITIWQGTLSCELDYFSFILTLSTVVVYCPYYPVLWNNYIVRIFNKLRNVITESILQCEVRFKKFLQTVTFFYLGHKIWFLCFFGYGSVIKYKLCNDLLCLGNKFTSISIPKP